MGDAYLTSMVRSGLHKNDLVYPLVDHGPSQGSFVQMSRPQDATAST